MVGWAMEIADQVDPTVNGAVKIKVFQNEPPSDWRLNGTPR